jgi:quinol monooxygenase YgiN
LHVAKADPTQFVLVERWEDQAALDAHFGTPHMAKLIEGAGDLLAAQPTIVITDAIPLGNPAKGSLAGA